MNGGDVLRLSEAEAGCCVTANSIASGLRQTAYTSRNQTHFHSIAFQFRTEEAVGGLFAAIASSDPRENLLLLVLLAQTGRVVSEGELVAILASAHAQSTLEEQRSEFPPAQDTPLRTMQRFHPSFLLFLPCFSLASFSLSSLVMGRTRFVLARNVSWTSKPEPWLAATVPGAALAGINPPYPGKWFVVRVVPPSTSRVVLQRRPVVRSRKGRWCGVSPYCPMSIMQRLRSCSP